MVSQNEGDNVQPKTHSVLMLCVTLLLGLGLIGLVLGCSPLLPYDQWAVKAQQQGVVHSVSYDGNGNVSGNVPVDSNVYSSGKTVSVLGNTGGLSKPGYALVGWNTQANGSGTTYAQGQTFSMGGANVTLYAQWSTLYTVTYNGNGNTGGTAPTDPNSYTHSQTVTVLGNPGGMVKTGYSFIGWNTLADGSGTSYTQSQTFLMGNANITLYAKWTNLPTYTVTYNGNGNAGGTPPMDTTNYLQGANVTVLGNTGNLVKTGSGFTGWNTQPNGSGTSYSAGATFIMGSANVTLYVVWTAAYTVTYNGNGNTGGTPPTDANGYLPGATVTVLGNSGNLVRNRLTPLRAGTRKRTGVARLSPLGPHSPWAAQT